MSMRYDLRLRFNCIDDKICVEFQKNIDKLAPAVRTKSAIANAKLSDNEKELLIFLQQIEGKYPPFIIQKELFCELLFEKIANLNFYLYKLEIEV